MFLIETLVRCILETFHMSPEYRDCDIWSRLLIPVYYPNCEMLFKQRAEDVEPDFIIVRCINALKGFSCYYMELRE